MRLGIGSYTFGWAVAGCEGMPGLSAFDLIDRAVEYGVSVVQLCDNLAPETYSESSFEALAEYASKAGISIELGTRGINADHLRRFIRLATKVKSPILRVVIDSGDDHPSPDQVVRRLSAVMSELEAAGITLAIENHDRFAAAALAGIIQRLGTPLVGICLDTVNSFGALEGPQVVVETLGPYIVNLHLKDFAVTRFPHLQGFTIEGRPAGEGMLNVPWLLEKVREFGRAPNAIVELWTPPEPTPRATVDKESTWAQRSVRNLRQYIKD